MTGEEILAKAKVIFVDNTLRLPKEKEPFKKDINNFLGLNEYLKVGSNQEGDFYTDPLNCHHYTTKYWCSKFDIIFKYMGISYDDNDFLVVSRQFNTGDFSFLIPKMSPYFRLSRTPYKVKDGKLIYWGNGDVKIGRYEDISFIPEDGKCETSPYHSLFKGMHEPCMVENLGLENGKTVILSGNSHMIPIIPVLAYYCKKVICLDVRTPIDYSFLYKDLNINDVESYLFISYDDSIEKFTKLNLK